MLNDDRVQRLASFEAGGLRPDADLTCEPDAIAVDSAPAAWVRSMSSCTVLARVPVVSREE